MKTIEETKAWLLENRVNKDGNIWLDGLDFSDFDGDVYIGFMKVKNNLCQQHQEVGGSLCQYWQKVDGHFVTQKLEKDEEYKLNALGFNTIVKKQKTDGLNSKSKKEKTK
ncbi:MAG: hypothetical protein RR523_15665 [Cetobacterium sp.]